MPVMQGRGQRVLADGPHIAEVQYGLRILPFKGRQQPAGGVDVTPRLCNIVHCFEPRNQDLLPIQRRLHMLQHQPSNQANNAIARC